MNRRETAFEDSIIRNISVMPRGFSPFEGIAFRAAAPRDADVRRAAASTRQDPGRFNTPAFGAFYASADPETAIEELRRTVERAGRRLTDAEPCSLHLVRVHVGSAVDLSTQDEQLASALSSDEMWSDDMRACQETAMAAFRKGAEAIVWPSAARHGRSLAVFVDQLQPSSTLTVLNAITLDCDMLAELDGGTPIHHLTSIPGWPPLSPF